MDPKASPDQKSSSGGAQRILGRTLLICLIAACIPVALRALPRVNLPKHLLHHPVVYKENFLSEDVAAQLLQRAKDSRTFPTIVSDLQFYKTRHEHIGEAQPFVNGSCAHPFLVPNVDRTLCILPGRVDVARHYIKTGGYEGLKEPYQTLISRVQSFSQYNFHISSEGFDTIEKLFADASFQDAAAAVCPDGKKVLDAFQYNIIVQVPGQTVAAHTDAPYFWGMDRFDFPQWLLVSMVFSGLFKEHFIDQVQVVAYFHTWTDKTGDAGGKFVYWDDNSGVAKFVEPVPRSASAVDGSKLVHAASVFYPNVKPPVLDRSKKNELVYLGDDKWGVFASGVQQHVYDTNQLRFSLVYRARCFESPEQKLKFEALAKSPADRPSLEHVLSVFRRDLVSRGKLSASNADVDPLTLAMTIMDTYINYPLPTATMPFNYCALAKLVPWTQGAFDVLRMCQ